MTADPSSGASIFWTWPNDIVGRARALVERGLLAEADELLGSAEGVTDPQTARAGREGREIIRRIRWEYGLTAEELLERIRKTLPDTTAADLERWRAAGEVQHRLLDGKLWYWRREPANCWKLCAEAERRRAAAAGRDPDAPEPLSEGQKNLLSHLARVVAAARSAGRAEVEPMRHHIRYTLTVDPHRPGAKPGSTVRCWLPFPQEYGRQRQVRLIRTTPVDHVIAPNVIDGKPMTGAAQRTIYFEQAVADPARAMTFVAEYEYESYAYYPQLDDGVSRAGFPQELAVYLNERRPHVCFTPEIRSAVDEIVAGRVNPLARARSIFYWFDEHIRYVFEEEYSTIPSFCEKVFRLRRGDCGVQVMLFITMCRLAGVPARWQSGWATCPGHWNMHDWAEVYVAPWGWLPVDVSYGQKRSEDPAVREFYFGHQDAYRLVVNLDYGCELHPPKQDLRSETADFQRGEVEIDGRNLYFDEWDYDFGFTVEPVSC
jgi:transglutaminase-like putative cysteine protease